MSKLIIFGTGSFAQLALFYFGNDSQHEVIAFTVNEDHMSQLEFQGLPVVPFEEIERQYPPDSFDMYVAVGYKDINNVRARIYSQAKEKEYELVSYISSKCTYWGEAIGDNCFIFEDNTIQPFVSIGNNVVMWSGNHIGHHSTIGNHCFISSHVVVSGNCRIGDYCFIGVNATIRDSISIGNSCIIGAGSLIMKSTNDKELFISNRTRPDKRSADQVKI
jgi:sugar O-acyltransferase (sialic acid O-acetyltransferase NeuD family)